MVGAWELAEMKRADLPEDAASAFSAVTEDLVGATYMPVLFCGTQVVHGINYMIMCKQTLSDGEATEHLVSMIINEKKDAGKSEYSIYTIIPVI